MPGAVWLCQIAKHLYFAAGKKQKRRQEFSSPHMLERLLCDEEDAMRIHALLHQMEEPYKEVFMLRVFGELPFKKIACIFGKTENWARGIIPVKNGTGTNAKGIYSGSLNAVLDDGKKVRVKEIYYGTQKEHVLLWSACN